MAAQKRKERALGAGMVVQNQDNLSRPGSARPGSAYGSQRPGSAYGNSGSDREFNYGGPSRAAASSGVANFLNTNASRAGHPQQASSVMGGGVAAPPPMGHSGSAGPTRAQLLLQSGGGGGGGSGAGHMLQQQPPRPGGPSGGAMGGPITHSASHAQAPPQQQPPQATGQYYQQPPQPRAKDYGAQEMEQQLASQGMDSVYDPEEETVAQHGRSGGPPPSQSGETHQTAPLKSPKVDTSDMRSFLMQPGPKNGPVQCHIIRDKGGSTKLFPKYALYLSDGDMFLLSARKRKKSKSSNYVISLDEEE
mmetsp:Transcript_6545/g.22557  ORF Transcript_6545/g.22557 Transcript_6545/m.22557 type:complete len:306 (-) Transcript_6545:67-984(-)